MVCFHSQQAAEKALKGFLLHHKNSPPRTHNFVELTNRCSLIDGHFKVILPKMAVLNQFYAPTRYPDAALSMAPHGMPDMTTASKALSYAKEVYEYVLSVLK